MQATPTERVPASIKLALVLAFIVATSLAPRKPHWIYEVFAGVLVIAWILARMPLRFALKRMLVAEFFIAGIVGLYLLSPQNSDILLSTVFKSNLCVFAALLLIWTTPFQELLAQLKKLKTPPLILTTLLLLYRYLPLLREESRRMQRARASRTFSRSKPLQWRILSQVAGQLFVRSADRAQRIYLAMCARGWR